MAKKIDSIRAASDKKAEEIPAASSAPAPETPSAQPVPQPPVEPEKTGDDYNSIFPEPSVVVSQPPHWLLWLLLLLAALAVLVVGYKVVNGKLDTWLSVAPTASPSPTPDLQATPSAEASASPAITPSAAASPSISPTASPSPTPSTATPKNSITLRVLNGTKVTGAAAKAADTLEKAGFTVRTTGNAKQQTYESTIIYYQQGREAEAAQVQQALTSYQATLQESTLANPDMVLVVIGKE